jgi:hypothetical protein
MDNLDQLAAVLRADQRLAELGYPRSDDVAKSGTLEARTMALAGDVFKRTAELVEAVNRRIGELHAAVDANAQGIAQIQTADLQHRLALANARPAGRA